MLHIHHLDWMAVSRSRLFLANGHGTVVKLAAYDLVGIFCPVLQSHGMLTVARSRRAKQLWPQQAASVWEQRE